MSDGSIMEIPDYSKIKYVLYYDYAREGRNSYEFAIVYEDWIEYENQQIYICVSFKTYCDYEE